jgi:hypothetical protein
MYRSYANQIKHWKKFLKPKCPHNLGRRWYFQACWNCGSKHHINRHHTGSEFRLGIKCKYYAQRYLQFYPEDIYVLCKKCHKNAHISYQRLDKEFNSIDWKHTDGRAIRAKCDKFRNEYREIFQRWLKKNRRRGKCMQSL